MHAAASTGNWLGRARARGGRQRRRARAGDEVKEGEGVAVVAGVFKKGGEGATRHDANGFR